MYYRCRFIDCPPISMSINIRSRIQTRKSLVEVPHCVVVLNGMAFETILSRGNGLLIGTFTMRFIYILVILIWLSFVLIVYIIFCNQNVSNGQSVTVHNCNCIFINAPLVVHICKTECNKELNLQIATGCQ